MLPRLLHLIVLMSNVEILELILKSNIDINQAEPMDKYTPLMLACSLELNDVVKILVS